MTLRQNMLRLMTFPGDTQRTQEWFDARRHKITSSSAACAIRAIKPHFEAYYSRYKLKAPPENPQKSLSRFKNIHTYLSDKKKDTRIPQNKYMAHGQLFEPVVTQWYQEAFNRHVMHFGLITHPEHDFLGASNDGITTCGVVLEIKCPQKICKTIPIHYWVQVQFHLQCTQLEYCDYVQMQIKRMQYKGWKAYDGLKSALVQYVDDNGKVVDTIYPYFDLRNMDGILKRCPDDCSSEVIYFIVEKHQVDSVQRDDEWFRNVMPDLEERHSQIKKGMGFDPKRYQG